MSEAEAIRAATGVAARTVADDVGTLEAGDHADLVVFEERPLEPSPTCGRPRRSTGEANESTADGAAARLTERVGESRVAIRR